MTAGEASGSPPHSSMAPNANTSTVTSGEAGAGPDCLTEGGTQLPQGMATVGVSKEVTQLGVLLPEGGPAQCRVNPGGSGREVSGGSTSPLR